MAYDDGEVRQQFSMCFMARLLGGELTTCSQSKEVAWVAAADTEVLQMHPSMRMRLAHYLEHRASPNIG
jgi:hypothetical protein